MDGLMLLAEAKSAGLELRAEGNLLIVRGPRSAEALAHTLLACKYEVLALLARDDVEVAWRIAAMRPQVPLRGPIPMLCARPDALSRDAPGYCQSCGERREDGQRYVCVACMRAKWFALNEQREGVEIAAPATAEQRNGDSA